MLIFIEVFSSNRLMSDIKFRQFSLSTLFYDPPYITWMCQPQPDDYQVYVFCGSLLIMSRSKNYRRLSLCFIHADYFRVESDRERDRERERKRERVSRISVISHHQKMMMMMSDRMREDLACVNLQLGRELKHLHVLTIDSIVDLKMTEAEHVQKARSLNKQRVAR